MMFSPDACIVFFRRDRKGIFNATIRVHITLKVPSFKSRNTTPISTRYYRASGAEVARVGLKFLQIDLGCYKSFIYCIMYSDR